MTRFDHEFDRLRQLYQRTREQHVLDQLISLTQRFVEDEKLGGLWDEALRKLTKLEEIIALTPRLSYRKAVLLYNLGELGESQALFHEIVGRKILEEPLVSRAHAYLGLCFVDQSRLAEALEMKRQLSNTTDSKVEQLLELLEVKFRQTDRSEEESTEEGHVAFTSEESRVLTLTRRKEIEFRSGHRPTQYDIYLDQIMGNYYIKGREIPIRKNHLRALFALARYGRSCDFESILDVVYGEEYQLFNDQQRDKMDQFMRRLRRKVEGLGLQINGYRLSTDVRVCLLYEQQWVEDHFYNLETRWDA